MKKTILLFSFSLIVLFNSYAQLTKGNWLVGGNANFSSASYSNTVAATYTQTQINLSPNFGYFFVDKFSIGLKPGYSYVTTTLGISNISTSTFNIGPFIRYYFLNAEKRINIFSEACYQHIISKTTDNPSSSTNGYSILAGPVVYFNQSVGIEFTVGYSYYKYSSDANSRNSTLLVGIGLQVHLEKENN